jgi:hypothetical protein
VIGSTVSFFANGLRSLVEGSLHCPAGQFVEINSDQLCHKALSVPRTKTSNPRRAFLLTAILVVIPTIERFF